MAITKSAQVFKDRSLDLEARIVAAVGSAGPRNVAQIARMTGAHQETVRYKIKKQLAGRGFRFQAEVDYAKLGLSLHWAKFVVSPVYYKSAPRLFNVLNSEGYLIHYAKILPRGHYVALFALPAGRGAEFRAFLDRLSKRKVFAEFEVDGVVAERHKAMDVASFNFQAGRWEVDWQKVKASSGSPLPVEKGPPGQVADDFDMMIIKELQIDALQHTTKIARKLKVNEKTLEYHSRRHVTELGLLRGYRVRWMRDLTKTMAHSLMVVRLTFSGLKEESYRKVQGAVSKIPFLWVEARLSEGAYIATLAVPYSDVMETMAYLNDELQFLGPNVDIGYMKVGDSFNFTIPYHMFSGGEWRFDPRKMEGAVLKELRGGVEK